MLHSPVWSGGRVMDHLIPFAACKGRNRTAFEEGIQLRTATAKRHKEGKLLDSPLPMARHSVAHETEFMLNPIDDVWALSTLTGESVTSKLSRVSSISHGTFHKCRILPLDTKCCVPGCSFATPQMATFQ